MITNNNTITPTFKGYDARPLKGFLVTSNYKGIAQELRQIGEKQGFDVFLLRDGQVSKNKFPDEDNVAKIFAQDYWSIINGKLSSFYNERKSSLTSTLKLFFGLKNNPIQNQVRNSQEFVSTEKHLFELKENVANAMKSSIGSPSLDRLVLGLKTNLDGITQHYRALCNYSHIQGGNFYFAKNAKGQDSLLIGEDELSKFTPAEIKKMFDVNNVCVVPQMDNHIDLFLRPLRNGIVLVGDETKTNDILKACVKKLDELVLDKSLDVIHLFAPKSKEKLGITELFTAKTLQKRLEHLLKRNEKYNDIYNIPDLDEVEDCLKKANFTPIRVPASVSRIVDGENSGYDFFKDQYLNYLNACTTVNRNGDIVFITNKDSLDKGLGFTKKIKSELGINFEEIFKESVKDYIKPENIYFISGKNNVLGDELLLERQGGLHCITMEIPDNINSIK